LYQSAYGIVLALRFAIVGQTGNESTGVPVNVVVTIPLLSIVSTPRLDFSFVS
jgi:hypothetical protein